MAKIVPCLTNQISKVTFKPYLHKLINACCRTLLNLGGNCNQWAAMRNSNRLCVQILLPLLNCKLNQITTKYIQIHMIILKMELPCCITSNKHKSSSCLCYLTFYGKLQAGHGNLDSCEWHLCKSQHKMG